MTSSSVDMVKYTSWGNVPEWNEFPFVAQGDTCKTGIAVNIVGHACKSDIFLQIAVFNFSCRTHIYRSQTY